MVCGAARADDCDPVRAATLAGISRPYAATIRTPGGDGLPVVSHVVMTGEKMYVEVRRNWSSKNVTTKELVDKANKSAAASTLTCRPDGEEAIGGDPATIYSVDTESAGHVSHSRIWISRASGLPLKTENSVGGSDVMTSLFDYRNVEPPADAK
jgi:outer membrane lipoprotein-sorting protein